MATVATLLGMAPVSAWAVPDSLHADAQPTMEPADAASIIRAKASASDAGNLEPSSGVLCANDGCFQLFGDAAITVAPGSQPYLVRPPFLAIFKSARDSIGLPLSDQVCGLSQEGCVQAFSRQDASIYWSPKTGAALVKGEVKAAWLDAGAEFGEPGYPLGPETCTEQGCLQEFEHMTITWSPQRGPIRVAGPIREHWRATGAEKGRYGWPLGAAECQTPQGAGAACTQQFEHGRIRWTQSNGVQIPV